MSIFELCQIAGLTLSHSRSSNTFTLTLDLAYCFSTFNFCVLNSTVCLSFRKRTSVISLAIPSFFFNALSLFDIEPANNELEYLLDFFYYKPPGTLALFDVASMAASLYLSTFLIQPWIFCLNCSMMASILSKTVFILLLLFNW